MPTITRMARVLLLALLLTPLPARAYLDQTNPWVPQVPPIEIPATWIGTNGLSDYEVAQTFTVGLSGPLSEVRVHAYRTTGFALNLIVEVRPVVGGVPSADASSALVSKSIPYYLVGLGYSGGWVAANFGDAAPEVTSGQQLAIVLRTTAPAFYGASQHIHDLYTGGDAFRRQGTTAAWTQICASGGCSTALNRSDLFFKTYVGDVIDLSGPPPVLPALSPIAQGAVALLLAGTAIALGNRRRPPGRG